MEHFYSFYKLEDEIGLSADLCTNEKELIEAYLCIICYDIPFQAQKCGECEKIICSSCAGKLLSNFCPNCKVILKLKDFNKLEKNTINLLRIKCINKSCDVSLNYENIIPHIKKCPFTKIKANCNDCSKDIHTTNDFKEILTHLKTCIEIKKLCKTDSEVSYRIGNIFQDKREYKEAVKYFDKALTINSKNDIYHYHKGRSLLDLKKHKKAIKCFDKAIEIFANCDQYYKYKGMAMQYSKRYNKALECFDKAIEIKQNGDELYNAKGDILIQLKKYSEAIECYNKAIQINPNYGAYHFNMGSTLKNLERYDEALVCLKKAITMNPDDSNWLYLIGLCYDKLSENNTKLAIDYYNKAIALNSTDADFII
jgi:tetratricopeptide (TPR) repeat protein